MKEFKYLTDIKAAIASPGFSSASAEELRVLLAIVATGGAVTEPEKLSHIAGVSKPRALASLALWEGEGVITREDSDTPEVSYEFEERLRVDEIPEELSVNVARSIRNAGLATMIEELTAMLGEATLPTQHVKKITALYTEYSLNEEYILTLAAYLKEEGKLTVTKLINEAVKLSGKGIDTEEALDSYFDEKSKETSDEWEIRRILGIHGTLAPAERELFKKWANEYGYGTPIITEAYNIARMRSISAPLPYMDTLLGEWHSLGLTKAEDCVKCAEAYSQKRKDEAAEAISSRKKKKDTPTPKYGNFNAEDAFKKALSRSYGTKSDS